MPTEEEIRFMLPSQQLVLARAALAGITYEKVNDEVRSSDYGRTHGWIEVTKIRAKWPDGAYVGASQIALFADELEAAMYCLDWLDNPCIGGMTCDCYRCKKKDLAFGFKLNEGNEQ